MNTTNTKDTRAIVDGVAAKLVAQGKLIEGGWRGLFSMAYPKGAPPEQYDQLRDMFFAGAQHLHGCLFGGHAKLDRGKEPSENDMRRMDNIANELRGFINDFEKRFDLLSKQPKQPK